MTNNTLYRLAEGKASCRCWLRAWNPVARYFEWTCDAAQADLYDRHTAIRVLDDVAAEIRARGYRPACLRAWPASGGAAIAFRA